MCRAGTAGTPVSPSENWRGAHEQEATVTSIKNSNALVAIGYL
jgi:hypothetical protein